MKKVCLFPLGTYAIEPGFSQAYQYTAQEPVKMLGLYAVYREQRETMVSELFLEEFLIGRDKVDLWSGTPRESHVPPRPFPLGALTLWQVEYKEPSFFRELRKCPISPGRRIQAAVSSACPTPAMVALFFLGEVERPDIEEVEL